MIYTFTSAIFGICDKEMEFMHSFLLTNTFSSFYEILLPIGLILLLSKIFQIGCKKINFPIVVGMLLSGVCLALLKLIPN